MALRKVIEGGYCVGCGACAFAAGADAIRMGRTTDGRYLPEIAAGAADDVIAAAGKVCPFSGEGPDEDALAATLYPELPVHPEIGRHLGNHAGWVEQGAFRAGGSSGGLTSWIAAQLLGQGLVDAVVHVRPVSEAGAPLFGYAISETVAEVTAGAKSRYYPIELSGVLQEIRRGPARRVAVIGVPCFIKALRLVAAQDEVLQARIGFTIALVCGHLKSAAFAEYLAWQAGIAPDRLAAVDFRHKLPDRPASSYGFRAVSRSGDAAVRPMASLNGGDWGMGYFKLQACDYCDDVLGETADVSVGDAWLPAYVKDARGTNVLVVRSAAIAALLEAGAAAGDVHLEPLLADEVATSQRSGLNHRREGLAFRLHEADRRGQWRPAKRVTASADMPAQRQRLYAARTELMEASRRHFETARRMGMLWLFELLMWPVNQRYQRLYGRTLIRRIARRLKRLVAG